MGAREIQSSADPKITWEIALVELRCWLNSEDQQSGSEDQPNLATRVKRELLNDRILLHAVPDDRRMYPLPVTAELWVVKISKTDYRVPILQIRAGLSVEDFSSRQSQNQLEQLLERTNPTNVLLAKIPHFRTQLSVKTIVEALNKPSLGRYPNNI